MPDEPLRPASSYPGFPHGIGGGLLMERTCEQVWLMGAHIVFSQRGGRD
jgi:thioredoxin reductase (NADPH)